MSMRKARRHLIPVLARRACAPMMLALLLAGSGINDVLAQDYVPLEKRLTPEQRHAAGLDLL